MDALLTPDDLAARLGKSADFWVRRARRKEVPHVRIGQSIRFTEDDVAEIIRRAHVEAKDPLRSQTALSRARS